jgi:hypothetical protein
MKPIKIYFTPFCIAATLNSACAQSQHETKYIEVTGSAEMSVQPDEVELSIVLQDRRADFEKHENEFIDICKKYKVSEDQLAFKNANSEWGYWNYWWYWWYYRSSNELMQTYKIKVNSKTNLLDFVKELNKPWVRNISVGTTSNKDLTQYRKEVKKEAIRMAKEKATYLLEAIDESIGSVISIEEVVTDNNTSKTGPNGRRYWDGYGWYWNNPYYGNGYNSSNSNTNMSSNSVMNSGNNSIGNGTGENELAGLSKIKLRYEVKAKFSIK